MSDSSTNEPKTLPELFDATATGEEFGGVLLGMFRAIEKMMDEEDD